MQLGVAPVSIIIGKSCPARLPVIQIKAQFSVCSSPIAEANTSAPLEESNDAFKSFPKDSFLHNDLYHYIYDNKLYHIDFGYVYLLYSDRYNYNHYC